MLHNLLYFEQILAYFLNVFYNFFVTYVLSFDSPTFILPCLSQSLVYSTVFPIYTLLVFIV